MINDLEKREGTTRKHFFEPFGWLLFLVTLLLSLLSSLNILTIDSLLNFNGFAALSIGFLAYSIKLSISRLSENFQQRIIATFPLILFTSLIIFGCTLITKWQEPLIIRWLILSVLYISAFNYISSKIETEIKSSSNPVIIFLSNSFVYTLILLITFLAGLGLRIKDLYDLAFWVDESTSVLVAQQVILGNGQSLLNGEIYGRATIFHQYLAWFMDNFSFLGLNTSTRLANTPFYLLIFLGTFLLGKYLYSKRAGLIAAALFSFSWISISIFREARFYEMFTAAFLFLCLALIYLDDTLDLSGLYRKKFSELKGKMSALFWAKIYFGLIFVGFFGWLSFNTQEFTVLILYPIILFGILIAVFRRDYTGIGISIASIFVAIASLIYVYPEDFKFIYLLKYPQPDWKLLYADFPFSEFWNYLLINQYGYLLGVVALIIPLLIYVFNRKQIFLVSIIGGWYSIIALQGYKADVIRYYYPALPFLAIAIAITYEMYLVRLGNVWQKRIFTGLLAVILLVTVRGGWVESNSAPLKNSLNTVKNSTYDKTIDYLISTGSLDNTTIMTDNTFSMNYYLLAGSAPDYIVLDTDFVKFDKGRIERYTAAKQIDYREIATVPKPALFAFVYRKERMGDNFIQFLKNLGGTEIYKEGRRAVFYFPK